MTMTTSNPVEISEIQVWETNDILGEAFADIVAKRCAALAKTVRNDSRCDSYAIGSDLRRLHNVIAVWGSVKIDR